LSLFAGFAGVLLVLAIMALGVFVVRDRLLDMWQALFAEPTPVAAVPSPEATEVVGQTLAAPTLSPVPSLSPTPISLSTSTPSPTPIETPTPQQRGFALIYKNCVPHSLSLGSVKGQVWDKYGEVIPGARVRIMIDDYDWESDANPATTNPDGWYEWVLETGQRVKFVELIVEGESVAFSPDDFEVKATGGCFQHVDFVEE
jgi:hypothetical protein